MTTKISRFSRTFLAAACCGGALMAAHAQTYQEFNPIGPMVAVPQVMVHPAELTAEQRRQLATRHGELTRQQERAFSRAPRHVSNRALNQEADRQSQLNRQEALDARVQEQSRQQALKNMQSGG
ncbi:MAG: hypothetical protein V4505_00830 [Pseudomonadota bacterium]